MSKRKKIHPKYDYEEFKQIIKEELPNYYNKPYKIVIKEPWVSIKSKKYESNKHSISDLHELYMSYCEKKDIDKPLNLVLKDVAKTMEREIKYKKTLAKMTQLECQMNQGKPNQAKYMLDEFSNIHNNPVCNPIFHVITQNPDILNEVENEDLER